MFPIDYKVLCLILLSERGVHSQRKSSAYQNTELSLHTCRITQMTGHPFFYVVYGLFKIQLVFQHVSRQKIEYSTWDCHAEEIKTERRLDLPKVRHQLKRIEELVGID